MTTYVGPEYLIGNAFIYSNGKRSLDLEVIVRYSTALQEYWNLNNRDALVWGGIKEALYEFSEYFTFIPYGNGGTIILNSNVSIDHLECRFVGYLPIGILMDLKIVTANLY